MLRPKVLAVVRPSEGGIRIHLKNVLENLSDEFSFCVACPPEMARDFAGLPAEILPVVIEKGLSPVNDFTATCRMASRLARERFDMVHAHGFKAGLVGRMAAKLCRVPCLVTVHNDFAHANASNLRSLYLFAERRMSRWTDRYITVSAWLAEELQALYGIKPEQITVIPNGVAVLSRNIPLAKELPFPDEMPLVGTVARLAPQKGVEFFIRAAAKLQHQYPGIAFVVVGDGPLRGELEALSAQLGLKERLCFTGYRQDVSAILKRMQIYVQPSLSEGQGITVLEAMSADCPIVASAVGGLKELISQGENGLLVEPGDEEQLAKAISLLLDDSEYSRSLAEQGAIAVKEYNMGSMLEKTKDAYYNVIKGGKLI